MGFECGFEGGEGGGSSEVVGECIPEVRCGNMESSVPPGAILGLADGQEVSFSRPEGAQGDVGFKEVGEIVGSQVIECFVGGDEDFVMDSLFDREPV